MGFARDGRRPQAVALEEERALPATGGGRQAVALETSGLCPRRAKAAGRSIGGGAGFARDGRRPQAGALEEERALPATGEGRRPEHWRRSGLCPRRAKAAGRSIGEGPIAQLDRASDYESEGRRFESCWARQLPAQVVFEIAG